MKFAKVVFWIAGVWGILVLTPLYFLFDYIGRQEPPPLTHPQFYFGFISVAMVWQLAFLWIASDPVRFRPIMILAALEKFGFLATLVALVLQGRLAGEHLAIAIPDTALGILFVMAFARTAGLAA